MVEEIAASADPGDRLRLILEALDALQDLAGQVAVFEAALPVTDIRHYWVFHRMARVYADLRHDHAAFLMAAQAVQSQPSWPASLLPYRIAFRHLVRTGQRAAAVDLFLRHGEHWPEQPMVELHEIEPLLDPAQALPETGPSAVRHRIRDAEDRAPTPITIAGRALPRPLEPLSGVLRRAPVEVVEIAGGELLICNDAAVVCGSDGGVVPGLSVCAMPELVRRKVERAGEAAELHSVDEAVLLLDNYPAPNLAHFLLDQVSRLALYQAAGIDLGRAVAVGPELRVPFQAAILGRCGLAGSLGTAQVARVQARRLWVSSNCRTLQHPAHLGADWAIEYVRGLLGGVGPPGSGTRRLFVSRGEAAGRRMVNEAAVAAALADHGFETITPGAMAYDDQVAAFRAASHVVAAHGAALAHLVVCPPAARVLEIFHPLYATRTYALLATACGLDYAAQVGFDGHSDDAGLNDPALLDGEAAGFGNRDLHADIPALRRWL